MSSIRRTLTRLAVLALGLGLVTAVVAAVTPGVAQADAGNLLTNGSFESPPASGFLTVPAGDSTTIPGWTVVTPSVYGESGGSVDVVASPYWNAEDGTNSIDLAGSTAAPGGLYQDVTTTVGTQYALTYWSAVNGDQAPGQTHDMAVSIGGQVVATIQEAGTGRTLSWVQHSVTITATSTTTRVEFDDVTPGDTNQGPALDNVSFDALPDASISLSPATIAPKTTGVNFTVPVATFTDGNSAAPLGNFSALISWGDATTSAGAIAEPGGIGTTFTVSGSHTYTAHGTYTVGVTVNDSGGSTASVSDQVQVVDGVITCSGSGCSGTVTTPTQTESVTSNSTSGTILVSLDPGQAISCHDHFRHAPQTTTVTDTNLNANILSTVSFVNSSAPGPWWVPFAVCYQAQTPFTDLFGHSVTTGLLPLCPLPRSPKPLVAPCVQSITEKPLGPNGTVVEKVVVPPGDPRHS